MVKHFLRGLVSEVVGYLLFLGLISFVVGAGFLVHLVAGEWTLLVVFGLIIGGVTACSAWHRAKYFKQQEVSHG